MAEKPERKKNMTIRQLIILTFVLMFIITTGTISYLILCAWKGSIDKTIIELGNEINDDIVNEIDDMIQRPIFMNEMNHYMIQNRSINMNDSMERNSFFAGIVKSSSKEIYSVSYGIDNGDQ